MENKHTDTKGGRDGGMNWEIVIDIYMCVIYSVCIYIYIYILLIL